MERTTVESGTEWEEAVGYSRAVRVGPHISVSGTTATNTEGEIVAGNAYEQATQAISNVERALREAGGGLGDVVRTRMYVTDIGEWEQVAEAHAEAFRDIRPATTMVEVNRLIEPALVIEIEANAIVIDADADNDDGTDCDGTDRDDTDCDSTDASSADGD